MRNVPPVDLTENQFADLWNDPAHPMIATTSDTFAKWKGDIEKLCSHPGNCTYEQQQAQQRLLCAVNVLLHPDEPAYRANPACYYSIQEPLTIRLR